MPYLTSSGNLLQISLDKMLKSWNGSISTSVSKHDWKSDELHPLKVIAIAISPGSFASVFFISLLYWRKELA